MIWRGSSRQSCMFATAVLAQTASRGFSLRQYCPTAAAFWDVFYQDACIDCIRLFVVCTLVLMCHTYACTQGPRPAVTKYRSLNPPPVVPEGFDSWSTTMDAWGNKVHVDHVVHCCAEFFTPLAIERSVHSSRGPEGSAPALCPLGYSGRIG